MAIWPAAPPNDSTPTLAHSFVASAKLGVAAVSGTASVIGTSAMSSRRPRPVVPLFPGVAQPGVEPVVDDEAFAQHRVIVVAVPGRDAERHGQEPGALR